MWGPLALALLGAAGQPLADFSPELPREVGDVSGWERISGDVLTTEVSARYVLYVNPERLGLYQVIRYRIVPAAPTTAPQWSRSRYEKLVFNQRPGRAPLRCFERIHDAVDLDPHWRELRHGTPEYIWEMRLVMLLMELHRQALQQRESALAPRAAGRAPAQATARASAPCGPPGRTPSLRAARAP
jgi:hypothetical protein